MNELVADGIRAIILDVCKQTSSLAEIIGDRRMKPFLRRYTEAPIRKMIYALVGSGALLAGGKTQNAVYVITETGMKLIEIYEENFEKIKPEWMEIA